jgi:hypothetical protein
MKYLKNENRWSLTPDAQLDVRDALPVGNYTVCQHPMTKEYFLEESEAFTLPRKLYGKTRKHGDRILETFRNRSRDEQVGVFLSGTKGSGKTLLAKYVAKTSGMPTIIVNTPFSDERFMRTIQGIEQPAVIIFDEFEKMYDKDAQESILTLFDGVFTARNKVMIITCNDKYSVRDFFHNRPGRLRYAIDFTGLTADFIEEYCADVLQDGSYLDKILGVSGTCEEFNFDMLQTLVDELNRYGGDFDENLEVLNVKPFGGATAGKWIVTVTTPNEPSRLWKVTNNASLSVSPLLMINSERYGGLSIRAVEDLGRKNLKAKRASLRARSIDEADEESDIPSGRQFWLELESEHLFKVDPYTGTFLFKVEDDGIEFLVQVSEERNRNAWGTGYSVGRIDV